MPRKEPSFAQLYNYITSGGERKKTQYNQFYHNTFYQDERVIDEFLDNSKFLAKRKNGNYLYHEVISLSENEYSNEQQVKALRDLAQKYAELRAEKNLVFGEAHTDGDYVHFHLMISANKAASNKRYRLTKSDYLKIQRDLEQYVNENYPELKQGIVINRQAKEKTTRQAGEVKRRTGRTEQLDEVRSKLESVFASSKTKTEFFNNLSANKLDLYIRGKTIGILDKVTGKKHRIKTLGLEDKFNQARELIGIYEERKADLTKQRKTAKQSDENKPSSANSVDEIINERRETMNKFRESKSSNSSQENSKDSNDKGTKS